MYANNSVFNLIIKKHQNKAWNVMSPLQRCQHRPPPTAGHDGVTRSPQCEYV